NRTRCHYVLHWNKRYALSEMRCGRDKSRQTGLISSDSACLDRATHVCSPIARSGTPRTQMVRIGPPAQDTLETLGPRPSIATYSNESHAVTLFFMHSGNRV